MKISRISLHTQNFGGLLALEATREFKQGFPTNPDSVDYFQYIPYIDDTEETINKEMNIMRSLNEGPKAFEIEPGKFVMRENSIEIKRMPKYPIRSRDFRMNRSRFANYFFDLTEVAPYELKSRLAHLKKSLQKVPIDSLSNDVAKYFRWK